MSENANNEQQMLAALYLYKMPGISELRSEWMAEYAIDTGEELVQREELETVSRSKIIEKLELACRDWT